VAFYLYLDYLYLCISLFIFIYSSGAPFYISLSYQDFLGVFGLVAGFVSAAALPAKFAVL
jgi:hypothetical protein